MIRAFLALELPGGLKSALRDARRQFEILPGGAVRWTSPEQMHLTLRFLGDIPAADVGDVTLALRRACDGVGGFELKAGELGAFPGARRPRVLWIGLGGELGPLRVLQARVLAETRRWGGMEEREFHPHLTLGRVKTTRADHLATLARLLSAARAPAGGGWAVDHVDFIRSELTPAGARYTVLATAPLAATRSEP